MSLHELSPPSLRGETFEMFWKRCCAQSEFLGEYSEDPPLSREQFLEIIDEQYQVTFSENYSDEKRESRLAFIEHLRKLVGDREAYHAEMRQKELEHQAELDAWVEDVNSVCPPSR